jgi:hypothetical protein
MNYEITKDGKVYENGKLRSQWNQNGYKSVCVNKKNHYVHRLIAKEYIPNPNNLPFVNHINGIKFDNRIENLEWCTQKQNVNHYYNILNGEKPKGRPKKLTTEQVVEIRYFKKEGWRNVDLAKKYNVSALIISSVVNNKSYIKN